MKIKWFGMFGDSTVRDENRKVLFWESIKKSWALALCDPFAWMMVLLIGYLCFIAVSLP